MALCQVEEAVFEGEEIPFYEVKGILDLEDGRCIGDVLGRRSPVDVLPRITVTDVLQGPDDGDNRVARRLDLTADAGDVEIARLGFPRDLLCGSRRDEANSASARASAASTSSQRCRRASSVNRDRISSVPY